MKPSNIAFIVVTVFLLVVTSRLPTYTALDALGPRRQQQEGNPARELGPGLYRVHLEIFDDRDRPFSDILWFQKAAQVALDNKKPYFNVLDEKLANDHVEGVIELVDDPLQGEYDAREIMTLKLPK